MKTFTFIILLFTASLTSLPAMAENDDNAQGQGQGQTHDQGQVPGYEPVPPGIDKPLVPGEGSPSNGTEESNSDGFQAPQAPQNPQDGQGQ